MLCFSLFRPEMASWQLIWFLFFRKKHLIIEKMGFGLI